MNTNDIGKIIKKIRTDNNMTQEEFANKYFVTFQAVSKWENGKSVPDIAQLRQISKLFSVDISDILDGEVKEKKKRILFIIPIAILLAIIIGVVINNRVNFSFKKITTYDTNFSITGSLAYDDKGKIYIYITDIKTDIKDDNKYKTIKVSLYENYKGNNTKIKDSNEIAHDSTIKDYLQQITFNIDDYKSSCSDLTKSKFYIEVSTTDYNNKTVYYKVNLELEDLCPVK